jgi:hypothetical protein
MSQSLFSAVRALRKHLDSPTFKMNIYDDHALNAAVVAIFWFEQASGLTEAEQHLDRSLRYSCVMDEKDIYEHGGIVTFVQMTEACLRLRDYRRLGLV